MFSENFTHSSFFELCKHRSVMLPLENPPFFFVAAPRRCLLEKNQVPRELTLIAISLTCLVAPWNSYGGRWKWVTILPILVRIVQLLFAICFCLKNDQSKVQKVTFFYLLNVLLLHTYCDVRGQPISFCRPPFLFVLIAPLCEPENHKNKVEQLANVITNNLCDFPFLFSNN